MVKMKYYYDTEFIEGTQKRRIGKFELPRCFDTKNTIDLISIGFVAEDGREYYAVSKDFNLKEAWYRYHELEIEGLKNGVKNYWIRENILRPIFRDLTEKEIKECEDLEYSNIFTFSNLKRLIKKYGKTNKQIANDIKEFVDDKQNVGDVKSPISFYSYYGAYDYAVLCWLFGKTIDLPKGFPTYSHELKQDVIYASKEEYRKLGILSLFIEYMPGYPEQPNKYKALANAKWNKELHEFLLKF